MPDGRQPVNRDAGNDRIERLNSAIDRLMSGGPTPVFTDPELHELLQLAARLRDELPDDLPDPAFRLDLKRQLTATGPVPIARQHPRAKAQPRFPWVAAVSAIAAVMLAAVSVGSLGIWIDNDGGESPGVTNLARLSASQQTATMIGFATRTAISVPGGSGSTSETSAAAVATEDTVDPGNEQEEPEPTNAETVPPNGASVSSTVPATTATSTPTPEPTNGPSLAAVPPVDATHVEQGPRPAADGGSGQPDNVEYVLETSLPDLGTTAEVYRLSPPQNDPEEFVATVAAALDMDGDIISSVPMGRTVYEMFDDNGSFHWTPETGAFTIATTGTGQGEPLSVDELTGAALDWLESINYPVDQLSVEVLAEPLDDTTWLLNARYASMPDIGFGHQIGVTIFISADGAISEATGYWLDLKQIEAARLHSADDIWQAVSSGQGYWTGGGIVEGGGEFHADSMRITYIMTRDPSGDLVVQPVVQTTGEFVASDGQANGRISCFVQAAQTSSDTTP